MGKIYRAQKLYFNAMGFVQNSKILQGAMKPSLLDYAGKAAGDSLSLMHPGIEGAIGQATKSASMMGAASKNVAVRAVSSPIGSVINKGFEKAYDAGKVGMDKSGRFQIDKLKSWQPWQGK